MDTLVIVFLSTAIVYMIWGIIRTAIYFGEEQRKYQMLKNFALSIGEEIVPIIEKLIDNNEKPEEKEEATILDFNQND